MVATAEIILHQDSVINLPVGKSHFAREVSPTQLLAFGFDFDYLTAMGGFKGVKVFSVDFRGVYTPYK